jgi:hypothetical protein
MLRIHKTLREQGIYRAICLSVGTARKYFLHVCHALLIAHEYYGSGNNVAYFVVFIYEVLALYKYTRMWDVVEMSTISTCRGVRSNRLREQ